MNTSQTLQTKTTTRSNHTLVVMLVSCLMLALIIVAGALYAQSQQRSATTTRLAYCNQPRNEWVKLPYRVQLALAENCATATVTTAK